MSETHSRVWVARVIHNCAAAGRGSGACTPIVSASFGVVLAELLVVGVVLAELLVASGVRVAGCAAGSGVVRYPFGRT